MVADPANWLVGGGEMARVIQAKDWSTTPLGPIAAWPQSLRTTVSLIQASSSPISLAWGPAHTQIYNDGYWPICGAKHPRAMGQDFRECWASAFPVIGQAYETAWSGRSAYLEKMRMFLDRHGFLEETWFTFSFSPITDESGRVGGLFHPVTELTGQMLSERRTQTLRELAIRGLCGRTAEEAIGLSASVLGDAELDVPFAIFYLVDEGAKQARRVAQSGISPRAAGPEVVDLAGGSSPWAIAEAFRSGAMVQLDDGATRITEPVGPYPEVPKNALVLPIRTAGHASPVALLVAGVSSRLLLTDAYRVFFEMVAGAAGTALSNARAQEAERCKAELDRAKTALFSNVSHEFRNAPTRGDVALPEGDVAQSTRANKELDAFSYSVSHDLRGPLRAINGFSQILLADHAERLDHEGRHLARRIHAGAQRMTAIIDDLMALSQVGRGELRRASVNLTAIVRRIVCDLRVRDPSRIVEVSVADGLAASGDERLVTIALENLLANAWKFTSKRPHAEIAIDREDGGVFAIRDNGAGFDMTHSTQLFEPFRRLHSGTEFEGTGIGLAIVRRIVERHGGQVWAQGVVDGGATVRFTLQSESVAAA
jgi:signal transduction histidine kinase